MISALSFLMKIMATKENGNDESPSNKGIDDLQPDDDLTEILGDKKFLAYLLESLADHRGKLSGLNYVKLQPVFTEDFFATYWLLLMKIAQFEYVPTVTVNDHEHQGKIVNGFDSIHRSLFEICESRIHLRVTTKIVLNPNKLTKEDEIEEHNKFMLILLFVVFWVADKNEECPNVMLKEPMARLVHACFSKIFKDIYRGNDENFKAFIFGDKKDDAVLPPLSFSPHSSVNTSALSCVDNITSDVQESAQVEEATSDPLKEENVTLEDTAKVTENEKEKEDLQAELDAKVIELEDINNLYSDLIEEKHGIHNALIDVKRSLADSDKQVQSLKAENKNLQLQNDSDKSRLEEAVTENHRLKETVAERTSELEDVQKCCSDFAEEKNILEQDLMATKEELSHSNSIIVEKEDENKNILGQNRLLNENIDGLEVELDSYKTELEEAVFENAHLKDTLTEIEDEMTVLQNELDVNVNGLFDGENLLELEPLVEEEDDNSDSVDVDEIDQSLQALIEDDAPFTEQENLGSQKTFSIADFLFFCLSLLILFTLWIHFFGALIPSMISPWVYIQVDHDHLPPQ